MIYLSKHRSIPEGKIALTVEEYAKDANCKKVNDYLKAYTMNVGKVAKNAGLCEFDRFVEELSTEILGSVFYR